MVGSSAFATKKRGLAHQRRYECQNPQKPCIADTNVRTLFPQDEDKRTSSVNDDIGTDIIDSAFVSCGASFCTGRRRIYGGGNGMCEFVYLGMFLHTLLHHRDGLYKSHL
jgi:hypothetical protein